MKFIYIQYITVQLEGSKEQTHQLLLYRMIDLEDHQGSSQISTAYGFESFTPKHSKLMRCGTQLCSGLDKACQKTTHWFLAVKIWKFLSIRVFVKWASTNTCLLKKEMIWMNFENFMLKSQTSHTIQSYSHFNSFRTVAPRPTKYAKSQKKFLFRFQSETERHESIQDSWKGWPGKPPKPPAAERFEFRMSHAPCIPSSEPHWTWTTWTTVKTTNLIQFLKLHFINGVKIEPKSQNCNAQCPLNMKGHRVRVHCNAQPPAQASLAQSKQPGH